ncbi:hypothetical protein K505DRAFT_366573 [Melanomma pulvis-pyrius CBS 109.77]|uniref:Uncharacterized protein n=1 Tax=Melanomma pulvis-pyrius CBS 109.77 TaxID=1314802 RepID=A0A6A6WWR6_9PLEO|nr:hypothetical protein K505DRAFT_366573 [Melanomma pulvis-pyrius CBS 109.77]
MPSNSLPLSNRFEVLANSKECDTTSISGTKVTLASQRHNAIPHQRVAEASVQKPSLKASTLPFHPSVGPQDPMKTTPTPFNPTIEIDGHHVSQKLGHMPEEHDPQQDDIPRSRIVLAGPLQVARTQARKDPKLAPVVAFIERVCPRNGGKVIERDPYVPHIVYKMEYEMEDHDWVSYGHLMRAFGFAGAFDELIGDETFDGMGKEWEHGWTIPVGRDLIDYLCELVVRNDLGVTFDIGKPWEGPGRQWPAPN